MFVEHYNHVLVGGDEIAEQVSYPFRPRNIERRPHDIAQGDLSVPPVAEQILREKNADYVIVLSLVEGDPAEAAAPHLHDRMGERRIDVEREDLDAGDEYLVRQGLREEKEVGQDLLLERIEQPVPVSQFDRGGELARAEFLGTLAEELSAPVDGQVSNGPENEPDGRKEYHEETDQRRGYTRQGRRVLECDALRTDLAEDQDNAGHYHHRDPDALLAEEADGERRHGARRRDVDEEIPEEDRDEQHPRALEEIRDEALPSPAPLHILDDGARKGEEGRFRPREKGGEEYQNGDDDAEWDMLAEQGFTYTPQ